MQFTDDQWKKTVARLNSAYAVGGLDAMKKMSANERGILYAEKMADLREAKARFASFPAELMRLRLERAEGDVTNIAGFLKEQERKREIER